MKKFTMTSFIVLAIIFLLVPKLYPTFVDNLASVNRSSFNIGLAPEGVITLSYIIILLVVLTLISISLIKNSKESKT